MATTAKTERARVKTERKQAKAAISHAKTAQKEAKRLAKELPKGAARRRIDQLLHEAATVSRAAKADRKRAPRRAARSAERVAAMLEQMSTRLVPGGESLRLKRPKRDADAAARAKQRTKLLKRRRKQAAKVQKWAKGIAAHTVIQSITTPTDAEQAKTDRKRARRARREDARATS